MDLSKLRDILTHRLTIKEFNDLCYDLPDDVLSDEYPGSLSEKVQGLISFLDRRKRLAELFKWLEDNRSDIELAELFDSPAKRSFQLPVVVFAMNNSQAGELLDSNASIQEELTPREIKRFKRHKDILGNSAFGNLIDSIRLHYGEDPESWKPYDLSELTIKEYIQQTLSGYSSDPSSAVSLDFVSDKYFSEIAEQSRDADKHIKKSGGIVIIDSISLHHPQIRDAWLGSGFLHHQNIAILIYSPTNKNTISNNKIVEELMSSKTMKHAMVRFKDECELSFEIGVGSASRFKRWFVHSLHKLTSLEDSMHPKTQLRFQKIVDTETFGFGEVVCGEE